jgi:hypothetical protein
MRFGNPVTHPFVTDQEGLESHTFMIVRPAPIAITDRRFLVDKILQRNLLVHVRLPMAMSRGLASENTDPELRFRI